MVELFAQDLPGTNILEGLGTSLQAWGVIVGIIAIVVSGLLWALGAASDNAAQASRGKRGVLYAMVAVAMIGAAPVLAQWAFDLGQSANAGG